MTAVVFMEIANMPIFDRHRHAVQVIRITNSLRYSVHVFQSSLSSERYLKVTSDYQKVDAVPMLDLASLSYRIVDSRQSAVTLRQELARPGTLMIEFLL